MAASVNAIALHKGVVKMDIASTSTATADVSVGVIGFDITPTKSIGKHFTLASDWQLITEGGIGITVKLKVEISKTAAHIFTYLYLWLLTTPSAGNSRTFDFYSPDSTTGSLYLTGEFFVDAPDKLMTTDAGKGDAQVATYTLHSHSTITLAAAA